MSIVRLVEYAEAAPEVRAVYDEIMQVRGTDRINDFWKAPAHDPALLRRTWENVKHVVMAVVGLANQTNRLANGLRIPVDLQFK